MAQSYVTIAMSSAEDDDKDKRVEYLYYIKYPLHNYLEANLIIPLKHNKVLVLINLEYEKNKNQGCCINIWVESDL